MTLVFVGVFLGVTTIIGVDLLYQRMTWNKYKRTFLDWTNEYKSDIRTIRDLGDLSTNLIAHSMVNRQVAKKLREYAEASKGVDTDWYSYVNDDLEFLGEETDVAVLMKLPGVGEALARRLLSRFGTISDIRIASLDELKKVEQIGERIAHSIKQNL